MISSQKFFIHVGKDCRVWHFYTYMHLLCRNFSSEPFFLVTLTRWLGRANLTLAESTMKSDWKDKELPGICIRTYAFTRIYVRNV